MFREATGLNGTTSKGPFAPGATGKMVDMRLDTDVSRGVEQVTLGYTFHLVKRNG